MTSPDTTFTPVLSKPTDWHGLSVDEVAVRLQTDPTTGLSVAEARRRLTSHGPNQLDESAGPTFLSRLADQLKGFVVILLIVAAVISAALGELVEAAAIMAIVVLNAALGVVQEGKAEKALQALKRMAAPEARVIRDGSRLLVPAAELVVGDVVLLEAGNYVPADLRLVQAANLRIEEAALTGESVPVQKSPDSIYEPQAAVGDRRNCAYMSTMASYGRGTGIVVTTGMHTEIGRIAEMIESYTEEDTPLQRKLNGLGRTLGVAALVTCLLVFLIAAARDTDLSVLFRGEGGVRSYFVTYREVLANVFIVAVSLAIAAVPEGLPAIVTICLALGMREMVRRHALIRKLTAVETLGSATVICSDKTGTLTQNEMTVVRLYAAGRELEVTGTGYGAQGQFLAEGRVADVLTDRPFHMLLLAGGLCNDAVLEEGLEGTRMIGDPTEGALVVAAAKAGLTGERLAESWPRTDEIPFDSTRKRMSTIHRVADGHFLEGTEDCETVLMVKGAPDLMVQLCSRQLTQDGVSPLTPIDKDRILEANTNMARSALRVLALAMRPLDSLPSQTAGVELEQDLIFLGLAGMIDPARPEVRAAIERARGAGIRTVMVTGDYPDTALAIGAEIGLLRPQADVLTGAQIQEMSQEELTSRVDSTDVFARVSPEHKVRIVEAFKRRGHVAAMTGDGVNDAPALKRANIGVAMGITGTDVTKQTAHMVLTDDNYVSIVSAVEQGRIIYSNIRKFVYFLLSCNIAEIMVIFVATLLGWPVPLTAIQLLWLNLLSDGAPALALGLEAGDPDIMDHAPRPPEEPVINRSMLIGIAVQTVAITVAVLGAYWIGWRRFDGALAPARTLAFSTLVLAELLRVYTSRSERYPLLRLGVFSNPWMQYAVGLSLFLLLLVIYVPHLRGIFDTVPLSGRDWATILPLVLIPPVAAEFHKALMWRGGSSPAR